MRTKTVFDYSQLIHLWAHGKAPAGARSKTRNVSVTSDGALRHWSTEIAAVVTHKGKRAFLIDDARFSVTTSQIQGEVRSAVHGLGYAFHVECGKFGQTLSGWTPKDIVAHYLYDYNIGSKPSRYAHVRAQSFLSRISSLRSAIECAEFFWAGLRQPQENSGQAR